MLYLTSLELVSLEQRIAAGLSGIEAATRHFPSAARKRMICSFTAVRLVRGRNTTRPPEFAA